MIEPGAGKIHETEAAVEKREITLLIRNGVTLAFFAVPAPLEKGWHLLVQRDLHRFPLTKYRSEEPRLFRSLDAMAAFVVRELEQQLQVLPG